MQSLKDSASCILLTLAVGPIGISMTILVDPAATFFDKIEATIKPGLSKSSTRSILLIISQIML